MKLLTDIEKFMIEAVKEDADFSSYCTSNLGTSLTFFSDSDVTDALQKLPCMVAYGIECNSEIGGDINYIVQFSIVIDYEKKPALQDDIYFYPEKKILENIASKALALIDKKMKKSGLGGSCNVRIKEKNILLTPVGVADDIQAVVTLRLEEQQFI